MKKYTVETLKKENELFDSYYGINNSDVERVNHLIDMIEKSRSVESIQTFDVVEYTNEYGEYFPKATVTMKEEDIELCENAGIHLSIYDNELCGSASGGSFSHHKELEFTYKGTAIKTFWIWGNAGARANGGIYFTATVNLWECNNNKEKYSTKTHDKYYLSHRKSDSDYQYFASHNATSCCAWETEEEMQAWLRTYRAVTDGEVTWGGSVIWTYKEVEHHCSNTEYEALNVTEDIFLMNGSKRRCKRVYDDANCIMHTYFVWYWKDETQEFYARMSAQNKIIDSYKVDYFTNEENKIALEELRSGTIEPLKIKFN